MKYDAKIYAYTQRLYIDGKLNLKPNRTLHSKILKTITSSDVTGRSECSPLVDVQKYRFHQMYLVVRLNDRWPLLSA